MIQKTLCIVFALALGLIIATNVQAQCDVAHTRAKVRTTVTHVVHAPVRVVQRTRIVTRNAALNCRSRASCVRQRNQYRRAAFFVNRCL